MGEIDSFGQSNSPLDLRLGENFYLFLHSRLRNDEEIKLFSISLGAKFVDAQTLRRTDRIESNPIGSRQIESDGIGSSQAESNWSCNSRLQSLKRTTKSQVKSGEDRS